MIHGNLRGWGYAIAGLGSVWAVTALAHCDSEPIIMAFGGPITAVLDLHHRLKRKDGLFLPSGGGHLFWLPIWIMGGLWTFFGVVRIVQDGAQ